MPSRTDVLSFIGFSVMLICGMVFHQQNDNPTHQKQSMNGESSVETYDPVVAIEFGDTLSRVGMYINNTFELFTDDQGRNVTPSVVAYTDRGLVVGFDAIERASENPKNFIYDIKHLIGREWSAHATQEHIKTLNYDVVKQEESPHSDVRVRIQNKGATKLIPPEDIAAAIFQRLKAIAEDRLKETVVNVVITVPSYFNDKQREAIKDVASLAGLNTLRLMKEPNAACRAHGIDGKGFRDMHFDKDDEGLIIVYDIGAHHSEVTLESIDRGVFEKLSSAGDDDFGGYYLATIGTTNLPPDVWQILAETPITLVERVLETAKVKKNEIDGIVITGNVTHTAYIKRILAEYFPEKKVYDNVPPDEAVIRGAALEGQILAAEEETSCSGWILPEVLELSLWVETSEGLLTKLIPRNTVLPTRKSRIFSTATDNQSKAVFRIYEGERPLANQNQLLGVLEHNWIPLAPRGVPEIEVSFEIDMEWQLKIAAVEKNTGITNSMNINLRSHGWSWYEPGPCIFEAEKNYEADMNRRELTIKSAVEGEPKFGVITEDIDRGIWF